MAATAILTMAVLACAAYLLRRRRAERLLLWFGVFAGLYAVRLLLRTPDAVTAFGGTGTLADFLASFVDYAILIPAVLVFKEVYGPGWKSSVRVLPWLLGAYGAAAVALNVIRGKPSQAPDPAVGLLVIVPLVLVAGRMSGYRPPKSPEAPPIYWGWALFVATVLNEHLVLEGYLPWRWRFEPLGFLVLMGCLGYAGVRRFVLNEQRLVSVDEEMKAATRIQSSILPVRVPGTDHIRVAVRYAPMRAVAGDFYDFLPAGAHSLGVLVADVTGHGVPAALVASILKGAISSQAADGADPERLISALNQTMCRQSHGQLATAAYLVVDEDRRRARYCSAGHPPLYLLRGGSSGVEEVTANGLLLGVRANEIYTSAEFGFGPSDRVVLYTDGIPEATSPSGEMFGEERFKACILANRHAPCAKLTDLILREVLQWASVGGEHAQSDDVTIVAIDFAGDA